MKNLLLSALLVLTVSFSFASNELDANRETFIEFNSLNEVEKTNDNIVIELNSQNEIVQISNYNLNDYYALKECKITIKKKNDDGTYTEVEITIHNKSCGEVIKDILDNL